MLMLNNNICIMDIINWKVKFMMDWLISKKNIIYQLACYQRPLLQTVSAFIMEYVDAIGDMVFLLQKLMEHKRMANKGQQSLIESINIIRKKELGSIQQWKVMFEMLKFGLEGNQNNKKIELIFQNLDADIEYYKKLRERIFQLIKKNQHQNNTLDKTFRQKYFLESPFMRRNQRNFSQNVEDIQCENQKQKLFYNDEIFSHYKPVTNPFIKYGHSCQKKIRLDQQQNLKYQLYSKNKANQEKRKNADQKLQNSPEKTMIKSKTPKKEEMEKSSNNIKKKMKKYKDLFEPEPQTPQFPNSKKASLLPFKKNDNKTVQKFNLFQYFTQKNAQKQYADLREDLIRPAEMKRSQVTFEDLPEDSLEQKDDNRIWSQKRTKLSIERSDDCGRSLEKALTNSLLSSKKWELSDNDDSLEEIKHTIKVSILAQENEEISFGD